MIIQVEVLFLYTVGVIEIESSFDDVFRNEKATASIREGMFAFCDLAIEHTPQGKGVTRNVSSDNAIIMRFALVALVALFIFWAQ